MSVAAPKMLRGNALREKIHKDPAWAMKKILGQKPWAKQVDIVRSVFDNDRTECSGCVASGKTFAAATLVPLWLLRWGPGSRAFSIAPSFRQVDTNLWGYIPRIVRDAEANGTPLGCRVLETPHIEFDKDWYYKGFATDKPGNVHGFHGPHDLLILDDAQGISLAMMDELENMMAGGSAHILMLHNRVVSSGPSYDVAHRDAKLWSHVSISFWDMPNSNPKKVKEWIPGALSLKAVEAWKTKYGEKSNFYRSKVNNEYPTAAPDTLIPLDWVEAAFTRKVGTMGPLVIGGDIARFGDDSSALAPMRGRQVEAITSWQHYDLMYTTGQFAQALNAEMAPGPGGVRKTAFSFLDVCGMGGGPVDRLVELKLPVVGVDAGEEAEGMVWHGDKYRPAKEVFVNKRSQMWWNLRECLNPAAKDPARLIGLPVDLELQAQLTEVKYRIRSDGRIEVEPKHAAAGAAVGASKWGLKQRLGHSPDKGDAVVLVVWGADRAVTGEFLSAATPGEAATASSSSFISGATAVDRVGENVIIQNDGLESIE